jgi:hypothetical protein
MGWNVLSQQSFEGSSFHPAVSTPLAGATQVATAFGEA